ELCLGQAVGRTTKQGDRRCLFGIAGPEETVARALQQRFGCRAVVVTLRAPSGSGRRTRSAIALAGGALHRGPRSTADILDPIGAGDAFSAGLIAALLRSDTWATPLPGG